MGGSMSEQDLKKAITSTLRRQHFLSTTPAAQRVLPLAALAIGDYVARKQNNGTNVVENFLCGDKDAVDGKGILIAPRDTTIINSGSSSMVASCCPSAYSSTISDMLAQHGSTRLMHQGAANWLELKALK